MCVRVIAAIPTGGITCVHYIPARRLCTVCMHAVECTKLNIYCVDMFTDWTTHTVALGLMPNLSNSQLNALTCTHAHTCTHTHTHTHTHTLTHTHTMGSLKSTLTDSYIPTCWWVFFCLFVKLNVWYSCMLVAISMMYMINVYN